MIAKAKQALCVPLFVLLLPSLPAWAQVHPEDATFAAAREAFVKNDRARLERELAGLRTHPLMGWGDYFRLVRRLDDGSDTGVAEFIEHHADTYLAEKMRGDWLKWLVRRESWDAARSEFSRLQRPDAEATCHGLEARLRLGETTAIDDARGLLAAETPLAESCLPPLGRLAATGELATELIWDRLRYQLALGRLKEARIAAAWLPAREAPAWRAVEAIIDHPARHLAKLPERFADTRRERELAMFAALRMARADVRVAAARWQAIENRFGASERGFVRGRLALAAAMSHLPEAAEWFDQALALGAVLNEDQHAWRVRAVLRAEDWPAVARAIDGLPDGMATQPEWVYWRARAHHAAGEHAMAQNVFAPIAGRPDFYGILAGEALGRLFSPPPRALPLRADELAGATANAGLIRGLALIRAGIRIEGVREWNWALRGADDRQLLAAAALAQRHGVIDRVINTADRTRTEHDFLQRYPLPFLEQVEPHVREVALDPAWVYGLMRQESRFIMDAKSSAGAKGLMQLMPATARWVAKKIGMKDYSATSVTDMDTNVILGTNYLRMVMDSLDGHPVLASAAYNAGPGRARKWRAERPIEGAIYAETIPFSETRDYVKKVMANAIVYAALIDGTSPALTAKLGTIRPRGFIDGTAEDLP
jgi:soluble lytic murein transglycosylase